MKYIDSGDLTGGEEKQLAGSILLGKEVCPSMAPTTTSTVSLLVLLVEGSSR